MRQVTASRWDHVDDDITSATEFTEVNNGEQHGSESGGGQCPFLFSTSVHPQNGVGAATCSSIQCGMCVFVLVRVRDIRHDWRDVMTYVT